MSELKKLVESIEPSQFSLKEENGLPTVRIKDAIVVGVINRNRRIYTQQAVENALRKLSANPSNIYGSNEIAGQFTGEVEHPSKRDFKQTVVKWNRFEYGESVEFPGHSAVHLVGTLIPTPLVGESVLMLMKSKVYPSGSLSGSGWGRQISMDGEPIEQVEELELMNFDLVSNASFTNIAMLENFQAIEQQQENKPMPVPTPPNPANPTLKDLAAVQNLDQLKNDYPLVYQAIIGEAEQISEERRKSLKSEVLQEIKEEQEKKEADQKRIAEALAARQKGLVQALGADSHDDVTVIVEQRMRELEQLRQESQTRQVREYIESETAKPRFAKELHEQMTAAIKAENPKTVEEANEVIKKYVSMYSKVAATMATQNLGGLGVNYSGTAFESETGQPAFARASYAFEESFVQRKNPLHLENHFDPRKPKNRAEVFTAQYLAHYDKTYKAALEKEAQAYAESTTSDLNIPYSYMRAVISQAFPLLVAANVFDFGVIDTPDTRIYYETYEDDALRYVTVTNEAVAVTDEDVWVNLDNKAVVIDSVVVVDTAGPTTLVYQDDYIINHDLGQIMILSEEPDGSANVWALPLALEIDYVYDRVRNGEGNAIRSGKNLTNFVTLTTEAMRLTTKVTAEAQAYAISTINYDTTARSILSLISRIRETIDETIFYHALSAVQSIIGNRGGVWSASTDDVEDLVRAIGGARVKVDERNYQATAIVCSYSVADVLGNWFNDPMPPGMVTLNGAGYAGSIKGLPIYKTNLFPKLGTSFPALLVVNRELVAHRVFRPMLLDGPHQDYIVSGSNVIPTDTKHYYVSEHNGRVSPLPQKGSWVQVTA
jgi:hypothetical protein